MAKHTTCIFFIAIALSGCAALGTKTLYKSETKTDISKLGFTKPDGGRITSKVFPQTDSIFSNTVLATFGAYHLKGIISLTDELPIGNPDTSEIARICAENNLDGLVVSHIKFINVTYSMYFIPVAKNWDTEVEMKLFDKSGKPMLAVLHNTTKGNSYFMPPTADRTIHDGTEGAIKRLAKELGLSK